MVDARENAWFQKALRLVENDILSDMLYRRNKVICPDCFVKHFFDVI